MHHLATPLGLSLHMKYPTFLPNKHHAKVNYRS